MDDLINHAKTFLNRNRKHALDFTYQPPHRDYYDAFILIRQLVNEMIINYPKKTCEMIWENNGSYGYRCSKCKRFTSMKKNNLINYCPKCGTKVLRRIAK